YILTTSESVWRIQLKMYIFIQALMYIFKLAFIDGVEDTIQKKKIAYKVQDYDGENLRLFNETSFNTIKYVKQS
ncbi:hypothetical protein P4K43_15080, partial [Bacillus cereus]|nr:hypothetical protein [Bacillus cereus]MEB8948568.1 hypothetical protein [Bacillus cereus]MEB9707218.1 hypothetical protein [Bacillus cereus]MEB9766747.1 hypothetical protein [Bacillus cereus]MEC3288673.1 hypothetical protein [Bacillus cereus]